MSTSLSNAEVELSRQLNDYWAGTTTGAGAGTSLVDTALMAKANDWITDDAYDQITSGTYGYATAYDAEERKISSLSNTDGTLTVLAHTGAPGSGITYRVHRLFTASDKRIALVRAAKAIFPHCFTEIRDENLTTGNWLRDPGLEYNWLTSTTNTYWVASGLTMTKTTTYPQFTRGSTGAILTAATGYMYQSDTQNPDLLKLAGKTVTFKCKAWCNTASALRLGICYDGTNIEYGDYHPGTSNWADEDGYGGLHDFLWVEKQIDYDPTAVSFRIYLASATATAYVDDLRVIGVANDRAYIGDLGLAQDQPHQVFQQADDYIYEEPWTRLHGWHIDSDNYLYLPPAATDDYRLRIEGIGYLGFLVSGSASTAWAATIAIDEPQLQILVAQAIVFLCDMKILPTDTSGTSVVWSNAKNYWLQQLQERKAKFGMKSPSATTHYGV